MGNWRAGASGDGDGVSRSTDGSMKVVLNVYGSSSGLKALSALPSRATELKRSDTVFAVVEVEG